VRLQWDVLYQISIIKYPSLLLLQYIQTTLIMANFVYFLLFASVLSFVNALITFKDVDELAVITTISFKTIGRHDTFEPLPLMIQDKARLLKSGDDLEVVGSREAI
jgi:hypothetical protein